MNETASLAGVAVALLLPWLAGCALVAWLLRGTGQRCKWVVLGHGFFLGNLLTIVLLRAFDAIGMLSNFIGIAAVMALVAAAAAAAATRRTATPARISAPAAPVPRWQWAVVAVLGAWIALRYGLMARELALRPLFAWDAWMNWAPKAITWFHLGEMVPFVHESQWYTAVNEAAYTLGNRQASLYPPGVPLILTWFMLGADSWHASGVYSAWLAAPLALGMALYGHLRLAGVSLLPAALVAYLVLNMPFVNVHTVLAGYADIWLAGSFGGAIFALREWRLSRHTGWAVVFLAMLALCCQLKNPGILLALILAVFGLREWLRLPARLELAAAAVALALCIVVVGLGTEIPLPVIGTVSFSQGILQAGYIGTYEVTWHPEVLPAVGISFFRSVNWNLLFYGLPPLLLLAAWRKRRCLALPPGEVLALLACAAFLAFAFFFTDRYKGAVNFSTLNRAILYLVPASLYCLALHFLRAGGAGAEHVPGNTRPDTAATNPE